MTRAPNVTNVMITSGGGPGVWGLLHALRTLPGRRAQVFVHDPEPHTFGTELADVAVRLPAAADPDYPDRLLSFCTEQGVHVLIPVYDGELRTLARRREAFESRGTRVLLPPTALVDLCVDKWATHERLAGTDFLPAHRLVSTVEQTERAIRELGYPERCLCARPVDLSGSRGLHIIDARAERFRERMLSKPGPLRCRAEEFLETRRTGPDEFRLLISEYLPGEELGVDLLAEEGRVVELVARRKAGGLFHGNPMRMEFVEDARLRAWIRRLARELELSGLLNVDARRDAAGHLRLLEINPRPSACIGMCAARLHLLAWAIDRLLGGRAADPSRYRARPSADCVVRALADVAVGPRGWRLLGPGACPANEEDADARAVPCGAPG